jgi:hypothetical protein
MFVQFLCIFPLKKPQNFICYLFQNPGNAVWFSHGTMNSFKRYTQITDIVCGLKYTLHRIHVTSKDVVQMTLTLQYRYS